MRAKLGEKGSSPTASGGSCWLGAAQATGCVSQGARRAAPWPSPAAKGLLSQRPVGATPSPPLGKGPGLSSAQAALVLWTVAAIQVFYVRAGMDRFRLDGLSRHKLGDLFLFQDIFTVSVGNLPPKAKVLIKITYITELSLQGACAAFFLPATVAPWQQDRAVNENTQVRMRQMALKEDFFL